MTTMTKKAKAALLDQILADPSKASEITKQVIEKSKADSVGEVPALSIDGYKELFSGIEGLEVNSFKGLNIQIEGVVLGGNAMFKKGTFSLRLVGEKDTTFNKVKTHEKLVTMANFYASIAPKIQEAAERVKSL